MRNLENAKEVSALGVDFLGFIFVPESPRYIVPEKREALLQGIPATIKTVGVFRNVDIEEVEAAARRFRLSAVQLHGDEDSAYILECKRSIPSCQIFKAIRIGEGEGEIIAPPKGADLYIFDGLNSGSGEVFNWELLDKYRGNTPFFLAGGVGPVNVDQVRLLAAKYRMLFGVDINSKVEIAPAIKSIDLVRDVMRRV
jgi:phosphoribosylanthranilate isomerase